VVAERVGDNGRGHLEELLPDGGYRVAKQILGSTKWDPAKWDRSEVNAGLAGLGKLWAKQAALAAKAADANQAATETVEKTATKAAAKTAPTRKKSRPGNGDALKRSMHHHWSDAQNRPLQVIGNQGSPVVGG
jgi:hypothetical protein